MYKIKQDDSIEMLIRYLVKDLRRKKVPIQFLNNDFLLGYSVVSSNTIYLSVNDRDLFIRSVYQACSHNSICFGIEKKPGNGGLRLFLFDERGRVKIFNIIHLVFNFTVKRQARHTFLFYRIKLYFLKKIGFIPIVGPDGVGKTTLISKLFADKSENIRTYRFKSLYRKSIVYHLMYRFLKIFNSTLSDKNEFDNCLNKICFSLALIKLSFVFLVKLFSNKLFLVDRYFHDYLIKDLRDLNDDASLDVHWQNMLKFIPQSLLFVHLDAPNEVILGRRQEVLAKNMEFYRQKMFEFYIRKPSVFYILYQYSARAFCYKFDFRKLSFKGL